MKQKKLKKKLSLKKNLVVNLDPKEQSAVKGGYWYTRLYGGAGCKTWHPDCFTMPVYACNDDTEICP